MSRKGTEEEELDGDEGWRREKERGEKKKKSLCEHAIMKTVNSEGGSDYAASGEMQSADFLLCMAVTRVEEFGTRAGQERHFQLRRENILTLCLFFKFFFLGQLTRGALQISRELNFSSGSILSSGVWEFFTERDLRK